MGVRIVRIGAGHAHLHLIGKAEILRRAGIDLLLISPPTFLYSGLATGALSGALDLDAGAIDVVALAAAHGVRHLADRALSVDLAAGQVKLEGGALILFDAISLNVGSRIADPEQLLTQPGVWPVKPLAALLALRKTLESAIIRTGKCPAIVVAGGGQTAHELAAALCGLCERHGVVPKLVVVRPEATLAWGPRWAARQLAAKLGLRGVVFRTDRVIGRSTTDCELASGERLDCDALVLATGLIGAELTGCLGLPVNGVGRLLTSHTLQAIGDYRVFAVGDCAVIDGDARPCVGVFGIRAAPYLLNNLAAFARGAPLSSYRPQRRWLSIMDLGDGTGLALWGRAGWLGASALRWKRWLDLGFVRRVRAAGALRRRA
jgi:NADH dehydrogenase FAD-containing subunit